MAVSAIIQEGGRAAWSLVYKACSDTIGVERKMLSGMETTNFNTASGIDTRKTITSLVSLMLTGSALETCFFRSSFFRWTLSLNRLPGMSVVSAKWVR